VVGVTGAANRKREAQQTENEVFDLTPAQEVGEHEKHRQAELSRSPCRQQSREVLGHQRTASLARDSSRFTVTWQVTRLPPTCSVKSPLGTSAGRQAPGTETVSAASACRSWSSSSSAAGAASLG